LALVSIKNNKLQVKINKLSGFIWKSLLFSNIIYTSGLPYKAGLAFGNNAKAPILFKKKKKINKKGL
jgi:hypothetical protein